MGLYLELANRALNTVKADAESPSLPYDINDLNDKRVHGITLAELRQLAGQDWPECERDPLLMDTYARSIATRRMRERGIVPAHYTHTTICAHCGPVLIFPGAPERVQSCPWCFNRAAGKPVPRAPGG